ncbi:YbjQ family protein [Spirulina subsalsa FACHB-351]|uniref:YbjQ family protein n=1 Tax=Spirulina subsalsa FACHB-351 TaxID=234711 RepID=A0ABT3LBI9_9CYAN|nr:YbjQ family protein [Spirulina subsalsa]MCW6038865.1 YbjQ family protein [Spirulina subsalsa FACHB-351]
MAAIIDLIVLLLSLGIPLFLLILGYFVGNWREKAHFQDLEQREKKTSDLETWNYGGKQEFLRARKTTLVVGSVVLTSDYFKQFLLAFFRLTGGKITVYESIVERARREALLRMKERAIAWGATKVVNVRYASSSLNGNNPKDAGFSLEVIAYGTAIQD